MYWISNLILILMFLPISVSLIFMPYFTRDTVSFGISVSTDMYYSEPLRALRKRYVFISSILYTLLLFFCLVGSSLSDALQQETIIGISVISLVVISMIINLMFYYKMKKYKLEHPIASIPKSTILAVDTGFRRNKLIFSNKWFIIHFLITILSAILAFKYYNLFPDTLAMKFDFQGNVTRSVAKSYTSVMGLNLMQFVMTCLFMFINVTILQSKQQLSSDHPENSIKQNTAFRRRSSLFMIITGLLMVLLFSFIQLNMLFELNVQILSLVSFFITAIIIIGALVLAFTTGQGGSRIGKPSMGSSTQHINDDSHWKLGGIYYNPQDPSIWIEKRMGIGWTVNFARPMAWIILLATTAIIIVVSLFIS
ncbi:DUF1648 domain-containing protein [Paenibacillus macquariensis]|uniref:Uncharacterized membrane protein n=1 Tax=Paenibacillus macquariensis TaxID=948756 RepID=A0ABY1KBQ2_9BACL|nr:DUF5808 domain-containing protein [Paenibacillus macquariensis]MEC0093541.1 DUF5808 domain-containing protein [Paenibacillus macquariensis]OAB29851.1 hypothetical protein PMSM_23190 [Paenibacillus macquariensis subsp. macquariensis]SIR56722.1 Uncharacterized membrane protein [Paenibacillus macquariensis]